MKSKNVKLSTRVILYDSKTGFQASRAYWMFKTFGHKNVQVLNGGLKKWMSEGRSLEKTDDAGSEQDYGYTLNKDRIVDYEKILQLEKDIESDSADYQILDARPDNVYGQGHIKTAKNISAKSL